MKITILGCGTSVGIPALGRAGWGSCDPNNPKNRRQRCAILVQTDNTTILVDAGPDIRNQLLPLNIRKLDAVLITHTHSDHVAGMDDLRVFYWPDEKKINLFGSSEHGKSVTTMIFSHPSKVCMSYIQHFCFALKLSGFFLYGSLVSIIHAFIPDHHQVV